jgi:ferrous iron transport protein B
LSRELGIPVVPTSARSKEGIPELIATIGDLANGKIVCKPHKIKSIPKHVEQAVQKLSGAIEEEYPNISNSRWLAFRVLEGDTHILDALKTGAFI